MGPSITSFDYRTHFISTATLLVYVGLLRLPGVADCVSYMLKPFVPGDETSRFEPLSAFNWVLHWLILAVGREVLRACWQPNQSEQIKAFGWMCFVGNIQGTVIILSHSMIRFHPTLEGQLDRLGNYLIRLTAFAPGMLMICPKKKKKKWVPHVVLISQLYLICTGVLDFGTVGGILCSITSLVAVPVSLWNETNPSFTMGFILLSMIPAILKLIRSSDDKTDMDHIIAACLVNLAHLLIMWSMICVEKMCQK